MALTLKKRGIRGMLNGENKVRKPTFTNFDCFLLLLSIVTYLADIGTDIIVIYQYFTNQYITWGISTLILVIIPSCVVQIFSLRWHMLDDVLNIKCWLMHILHFGICERYVKLLRCGFRARKSGDLADFHRFYQQQSDVCMLRLFESFMESAPQLILQLYIMLSTEKWNIWTGVSAVASLVSLSLGISAYSKAMRNLRPDKQRLSLCGMILQVIWRSGTVSSRILSMVFFACAFGVWLVLVVAVHWLVMTIWVIFQDTDFCMTWWEERLYNCVVGEIYCFCFFNLKEGHSRYRSTIFYAITFTENIGFLLSYYLSKDSRYEFDLILALIISAFVLGVFSMLLYYRFFHPSGPITFSTEESDNEDVVSAKEISIGIENNGEEHLDDCHLVENSFTSDQSSLHQPVTDPKNISPRSKIKKGMDSVSSLYTCQQANHRSHSQNCSILTICQDSNSEKNMSSLRLKQLATHHKMVNYNFRTQAAFKNLCDSQINCSCLVLMEDDLVGDKTIKKSPYVDKDIYYSLPNLNISVDCNDLSYICLSPILNQTQSLCNLYESKIIDSPNSRLDDSTLTDNKKILDSDSCECSFILPVGVSCRCSRKRKRKSYLKNVKVKLNFFDYNKDENNQNVNFDKIRNNCNINSCTNEVDSGFIQPCCDKNHDTKLTDNKNSIQNFHSSEIYHTSESNSSIPASSKICIVWNGMK